MRGSSSGHSRWSRQRRQCRLPSPGPLCPTRQSSDTAHTEGGEGRGGEGRGREGEGRGGGRVKGRGGGGERGGEGRGERGGEGGEEGKGRGGEGRGGEGGEKGKGKGGGVGISRKTSRCKHRKLYPAQTQYE